MTPGRTRLLGTASKMSCSAARGAPPRPRGAGRPSEQPGQRRRKLDFFSESEFVAVAVSRSSAGRFAGVSVEFTTGGVGRPGRRRGGAGSAKPARGTSGLSGAPEWPGKARSWPMRSEPIFKYRLRVVFGRAAPGRGRSRDGQRGGAGLAGGWWTRPGTDPDRRRRPAAAGRTRRTRRQTSASSRARPGPALDGPPPTESGAGKFSRGHLEATWFSHPCAAAGCLIDLRGSRWRSAGACGNADPAERGGAAQHTPGRGALRRFSSAPGRAICSDCGCRRPAFPAVSRSSHPG